MKNAVLLSVVLALPSFLAAQVTPTPAAPAPKTQGVKAPDQMTEDQKTLYFLGNKVLSRNLKQFDFTPAEGKYIVMGLSDALKNAPSKVDESYGAKLNEFIGKKQAAIMKKEKAKSDAEKAKAKPFLDKMAKEPGAVKLASGVIYTSIKEGAGAYPKATDTVKVHYKGTFTDGKVFDSSIERNTPAEFPLNQVIPCWTEGVQKIKVGGKAKLVCPSDTAYGDDGRPGAIPGGATLIFEVELLDITTKPEPKAEIIPAAKTEIKAEAAPAAKEEPKTEAVKPAAAEETKPAAAEAPKAEMPKTEATK